MVKHIVISLILFAIVGDNLCAKETKVDYLAKLSQVENDSKLNPEIYGNSADVVVETLNDHIKYKNTSGITNMSTIDGGNLTQVLNVLAKKAGVTNINNVTGAIKLISSGNTIGIVNEITKGVIDIDTRYKVYANIDAGTKNTIPIYTDTTKISSKSSDGKTSIVLQEGNNCKNIVIPKTDEYGDDNTFMMAKGIRYRTQDVQNRFIFKEEQKFEHPILLANNNGNGYIKVSDRSSNEFAILQGSTKHLLIDRKGTTFTTPVTFKDSITFEKGFPLKDITIDNLTIGTEHGYPDAALVYNMYKGKYFPAVARSKDYGIYYGGGAFVANKIGSKVDDIQATIGAGSMSSKNYHQVVLHGKGVYMITPSNYGIDMYGQESDPSFRISSPKTNDILMETRIGWGNLSLRANGTLNLNARDNNVKINDCHVVSFVRPVTGGYILKAGNTEFMVTGKPTTLENSQFTITNYLSINNILLIMGIVIVILAIGLIFAFYRIIKISKK